MSGEAQVAEVRRFNRLVTQRAGALSEHFLGRDRPLGASRLLWEIGTAGRPVRELRGALGLDSGYASRLLRSLEADGLVRVEPDPRDRRVRVARLTRKGLAERAVLDDRSDEVASAMLAPLSPTQREELVAAMGAVERLLVTAAIEIEVADPAGPDARYCLAAYFSELDRRAEPGFDPAQALPVDPLDLERPRGTFLVARLDGRAVGCGGVKHVAGEPAELKRMWVSGEVRGRGLGRRLLTKLEACAVGHGARSIRLDTNRALAEAIAMYRSAGYCEVPPFNGEPFATHWFEKRLPPHPD